MCFPRCCFCFPCFWFPCLFACLCPVFYSPLLSPVGSHSHSLSPHWLLCVNSCMSPRFISSDLPPVCPHLFAPSCYPPGFWFPYLFPCLFPHLCPIVALIFVCPLGTSFVALMCCSPPPAVGSPCLFYLFLFSQWFSVWFPCLLIRLPPVVPPFVAPGCFPGCSPPFPLHPYLHVFPAVFPLLLAPPAWFICCIVLSFGSCLGSPFATSSAPCLFPRLFPLVVYPVVSPCSHSTHILRIFFNLLFPPCCWLPLFV